MSPFSLSILPSYTSYILSSLQFKTYASPAPNSESYKLRNPDNQTGFSEEDITEYKAGMMISDVATSHTKPAENEHGVVRTKHGHEYTCDLQRKIIEHCSLPPQSVTSQFLGA